METDLNTTEATAFEQPSKVLVIGLDGATWWLFDKLMEDGAMPILAEMVETGTRGNLASTLPFLSPVAWTSMATGVYPGKHRVFGFFNPRYTHVWAPRLNKPTRPVSAADIGAPMLYRFLNEQGRTTGLAMVPVTHPPQQINGYIAGDGILTPNEESDYTYPKDLKKELLAAVPEFRVRPYEYLHHRLELIDEISHNLAQQSQGVCWLMKHHPTDFTMAVFTATDVIQHRFWKYLDPALPPYITKEGHDAHLKLRTFYGLVDRAIGELVAQAGPNTTTILMSDHGFASSRLIFFVNRWLYEKGLVHFTDSTDGKLRERLVNLGLTQQRLFWLLKKLDVLNLRQRLRGRDHLGGAIAVQQSIRVALAPDVDWSRTLAYAGNLGEPYIYINLEGRDPAGIVKPGGEYDRLCESLIGSLMNLRDPESNQPLVRKVYRATELYPGPYVGEAPDIILDFRQASIMTSDALQVNAIFGQDDIYRGIHSAYGILLLHGPGIQKGTRIEGARIADVMPTAIHLLGISLPTGLDGQVLTGSLTKAALSQRPVRYSASDIQEYTALTAQGDDTYTDEESSAIQHRLRDLGYIT